MALNLDLDTHLASNAVALAQQAVANTQNFAHFANMAFLRDLMQSGQSANAAILAGLNAGDRTPVIKTGGTTKATTTTS